MPKKRPSLREDENERAYRLVQAMTGDGPRPEPPGKREKNPEAVKRGRAGGKVGGKARATSLTPRKLSKIGRDAARKRWQEPEGGSQ
ncbi:MAG TPA: hypothetical protein VGQ24_05125 [Gemmatimonadales bacterium]|jgi:hypothetical protein|nr:hypothetical protein [Gemmatimonadales bacterium]